MTQVALNQFAIMPKSILVLVATLLPLLAARGRTKPEIDLIAGTVNGQAIAELTTDKVTDLFGRPSATTDPRVEKAGGRDYTFSSTVVYANLGLIFSFRHPHSDPQQRIGCISIYLSQQTHEDTGTIMKPFSEALARGINGNWKAKRVMEEFAQYSPTDLYDPKKAQETKTVIEKLKAMGMDSSADLMKASMLLMTMIDIRTPQTVISFCYEEGTKFLERIEICPLRGAASPAPQAKPASTEKEKVIVENTKTEVDTLLKDWSSRKSDRSNAGRSIYYYTKDVSVIVYYKDEKAVGVVATDRPGAGVTSISQVRYDELVKLIGQTPKGSDIKRDLSGIHEFSVGDTD